ncbi:uncharacterized protein LOC126579954 [Anopheles aquasalis]|uniref:uncharacterized protein LOC126579954 n=1 Tax=Anopheles aquasalis TaxID=42839 RepID=UPI00215B1C6E|nr:uncharacterized protein LOC126579954 [Anopheles aquasalis]
MSALSKHFDRAMAGVGCQEILHPGRSCLAFNGANFIGTIRSNASFFVPIALLRLLMLAHHRQTLSGAIVRQAIGELGAMMVNGMLVANCWTGTFCAVSRLTGRIHDNYSVSLAPLLGTFAMLLMPAYVKTTHAKAVFVANLECWIKSRPSRLVAALRKSRTFGTLCFMLLSAGIVQLAGSANRQSEFWFIAPLKPRADAGAGAGCCLHADTCTQYVMKGLRTYLAFSTVLELARRTIVTFGQLRLSPGERLKSLVRLRYRLILFLTLYNSTYRLFTCLLARARSKAAKEHGNVTAGFVSGLWYALYPNYNIFNLAVSTFCQVFWNSTMERYTNSPIVRVLAAVPLAPIVWSVSMCYVTYSRAYYPWAMSRFAHKFIDLCSNYASRTASENFARRFLVAC